MSVQRDYCGAGHLYVEGSYSWQWGGSPPRKKQYRDCKLCNAARARLSRAKLRAERVVPPAPNHARGISP